MFFRAYSLSILVFVVLWSSSTLAQDPFTRGEAGLPYHIKADSLSYDETTKSYSARDHVSITRGSQSLHADAVDLNAQTMEAEAWGNVRFTSGQDRLTGTRLKMDLDKGVGIVYDG
ncbi:MAG: LPS-assembly protein LptD, partial [Deltaproteobacteria bacterium]|nr:LPS-assembly protein LptD [Deltaproteobacteria bacterium]